jgi:hypothetical protein
MTFNGERIDKETVVTFFVGYREGETPDHALRAVVSNPVTGKDYYETDRGSDWLLADLDIAPLQRLPNLTYPSLAELSELASPEVDAAGYSDDRWKSEIATVGKGNLKAVLANEVLYHDCDIALGASGGPLVGKLKNGREAIVGVITFQGLIPARIDLDDGRKLDLDEFNLGVTVKQVIAAFKPVQWVSAPPIAQSVSPRLELNPRRSRRSQRSR